MSVCARLCVIGVFCVLLIIPKSLLQQPGTSVDCPNSCSCRGKKMQCWGHIHINISEIYTQLLLVDVEAELRTGRFCNVSWNSIEHLSIELLNSKHIFRLDNIVFLCLRTVKTLKLNMPYVVNFTGETFSGLNGLVELDLSGCIRMQTVDLIAILNETSNFPHASKLTLVGIGTYTSRGDIEISEILIRLFGSRHITDINLSSTSISILNPDIRPMCQSLVQLNISNSEITPASTLYDKQSCNSLRSLDISGLLLPNNPKPPACTDYPILGMTIYFEYFRLWLITSARILYANRLLSPLCNIHIINSSIISTVERPLNELHITGYKISTLDIEFNLANTKLKFLDMSHNQITDIGQKVFRNLAFLETIDLSNNKLSSTKLFAETFSVLFKRNLALTSVNLASNGLVYIPRDTFSSNTNLRYLELYDNTFSQLTFDISKLIFFKIFGLRNNFIENLDETFRNSIDLLYKTQQSRVKENTTVKVDLHGNPLSCYCKSLAFVEWFVASPAILKTQDIYLCNTDNQKIRMNDDAINESKEDCEIPKRRRTVILVSCFVSASCTIAVICILTVLVKRRRKRRFYERIEGQIGLLRDDLTGYYFLAFVSYSSKDSEFAIKEVLWPLKANLKAVTNIDRELICFGDRHFRPGHTIFSEILRCLEESKVVVVVLSRNYCQSDYCKLDIEQAQLMRKPIILILTEHVKEEAMNNVIRGVFKNTTRARFVVEDGRYRLEPDWDQVCMSILQLI